MWKSSCVVVILWCASLCHSGITFDSILSVNGPAIPPLMGWMSWMRLGSTTDWNEYPDNCTSESSLRNVADQMVSEGYKDAGYEYIVIASCDMNVERDINGRLVPDSKHFPNGIKALADYIHEKGLKLGVSLHDVRLNHILFDAQSFAEWDVDYVRIYPSSCIAKDSEFLSTYSELNRILNKTERLHSCNWPSYQENKGITPNHEALEMFCNLSRNGRDLRDSWDSVNGMKKYLAGMRESWDAPIIRHDDMSIQQRKTQLAIWAILPAPMIFSFDLKDVRPELKEILQNREVIKVNQDPLGVHGVLQIRIQEHIEIWVRQIAPVIGNCTSYAIAFVSERQNRNPYEVTIALEQFGLTHALGYHLVDLFNQTAEFDAILPGQNLTIHINALDVVFYKFIPRTGVNGKRGPERSPFSLLPYLFIFVFACAFVIFIICLLKVFGKMNSAVSQEETRAQSLECSTVTMSTDVTKY